MEVSDLQKRFYDARWGAFRFANDLKLARCVAILERVASTGIQEPRILDLGCGAGWLSVILGMFGPTVGLDLSGGSIRWAQLRSHNVRYIQANVFEWEVPKEAFDIVVSQEVIEHVNDQVRYLRIAWEALCPKGYLILTTPNKNTMLAMPGEQRENWSRQPIEHWLSIKEIAGLISRDFTILQLRTIVPGLGHRGIYRLFNSTRIENLIGKLGMGSAFNHLRLTLGLGLHIVVLARKRI